MEEHCRYLFPTFPKNQSGLVRGSVLIAKSTNKFRIGYGSKIPIGFDGQYIRSGSLTWTPDELDKEIREGDWEVDGGHFDLSHQETALLFIVNVEMRQIPMD